MNKRYNSIDNIDYKNHSSSIKNILHLGGENVILGSKFDIRKYFNDLDKNLLLSGKSPKKEKINKISLLYPKITPKTKKSNDISTSNYKNKSKNYYTIENESITNQSSNKNIFNSNHSSKNIYNNNHLRNNTICNQYDNCFLTSIGIEQNEKNNKNFKTIDARDYIISFRVKNDNNRRTLINNNKNLNLNSNFHISSIIKEIREKYKTKNDFDIKNDYISYNKKKINAVLNAKKLITNYDEKNDWDLKLKEDNYHNFIKNNKKICKQNILTKLICSERQKVLENEKMHEKEVKDKYNEIINDEKEFENIVKEQKQNNKIIEDYRIQLENNNKDLFYLKDLIQIKVQNKEAEIMKKLFEMEELRGYAIFVNNMQGKDTSIYEKEIYPMDYEKKIELNSLVKNTFEIYKDFLNENTIENRHKGNEPELIYNGFLGIEDKIRYAIKIKDETYEEIEKIKLKNKSILDLIIDKKNFMEKEYNSIKEECNNIVNFISKKEESKDKYFHSLAKELFIYILEILSNENINKYKDDDLTNELVNLNKICDLAEKSQKCISEKEIFINESIKNLEKFEKEDPIKFDEALDSAKERIILERQKEAKELNRLREKIKRIQAIQKLEKINFIIRKVEKPFHIKKKISIKIDPMVIKEKEDKELITYQ